MHDSAFYVNYNGELIPPMELSISINNRAFKYGDGLFETIRIINGVPIFVEDHFARLIEGMNCLKMIKPLWFNVEWMQSSLIKLAVANSIEEGARARISIFRKDGGKYTPISNLINFLIEIFPLENNIFSLNRSGISVGVFNDIYKPINLLSGFKTTNCLIYTLAGIYAMESNFDDCLILNDSGSITEAINSNIFVVKQMQITTPAINQGCIAGIMRKKIIEIAENNEYFVDQGFLLPADLEDADEIFLTNAIDGIKWVVSFKQKRYFNSVSKQLINLLNDFVTRNYFSKQ